MKALERAGTQREIDGLARYGITAKRPFGVPMRTLLAMKKRLGTDQALSLALWKTGWYEARLLAALVGDPERVTRRQMNAWAAGFENWGDCDTVCFQLFDRTPLAWDCAVAWAASPKEFVKRGGYVLMACLALHDKRAPDARFLAFLPLIEQGSRDDRNFVKKGVSWALRAIGRRSKPLHAASVRLCKQLATSDSDSARWIAREALREFAMSPPRVRGAAGGSSR
jgi:3-methyladenine DNA glycosylase AlkD